MAAEPWYHPPGSFLMLFLQFLFFSDYFNLFSAVEIGFRFSSRATETKAWTLSSLQVSEVVGTGKITAQLSSHLEYVHGHEIAKGYLLLRIHVQVLST